MNFEKHAAQGNQFVNEVARELGYPHDHDTAARIVRATLLALRSRFTMRESFQLLAQLPMALKAVYVDGWRLPDDPDVRVASSHSLADDVRTIDGRNARRDLPDAATTEEAIAAVLDVLERYVSTGEIAAVRRIADVDASATR